MTAAPHAQALIPFRTYPSYKMTLCDGFRWDRGESGNNGYGITSVLEGGDVLEKAAANISVIKGVLTPERAKAMSSRGRDNIDPEGGQPYSAVAMSLVFHSAHPFIPTLRADVRLFEVTIPRTLNCKPRPCIGTLALQLPMFSVPHSCGKLQARATGTREHPLQRFRSRHHQDS